MFTTGKIEDMAEWIIDDTCLVFLYFSFPPLTKPPKFGTGVTSPLCIPPDTPLGRRKNGRKGQISCLD